MSILSLLPILCACENLDRLRKNIRVLSEGVHGRVVGHASPWDERMENFGIPPFERLNRLCMTIYSVLQWKSNSTFVAFYLRQVSQSEVNLRNQVMKHRTKGFHPLRRQHRSKIGVAPPLQEQV